MQRLSWPFDNPNHLGCVIAICAPLVCACVGQLSPASRGLRTICMYVAVSAVAVLLGATGSRGAWVGAAVGLSLLAWRNPSDRRPIVGMALAFILSTILLPVAHERLATFTNLPGDWSTTSRLHLWTDAERIVAANPWTGIGENTFEKIYADCLRVSDSRMGYMTPVCDYLTILTFYGVPFFTGLMSVCLIPVIFLLRPQAVSSRVAIASSCSWVSFLVCAIFNSYSPYGTFRIISIGVLGSAIWAFWSSVGHRVLVRNCLFALAGAVMVGLAALLHSRWLTRDDPYSIIVRHDEGALTVEWVPRATNDKRVVIMFTDSSGALGNDEKALLVHQLKMGLSLIVIRPEGRLRSIEALQSPAVRAINGRQAMPIFINSAFMLRKMLPQHPCIWFIGNSSSVNEAQSSRNLKGVTILHSKCESYDESVWTNLNAEAVIPVDSDHPEFSRVDQLLHPVR